MSGLLLRRQAMTAKNVSSGIRPGFEEGTFGPITVDANGVFTLGSFAAWSVYRVPFRESIEIKTGDVVEFQLSKDYSKLNGPYCDGGFNLNGGFNSFQLKIYANKQPGYTVYSATATNDFTAQYWAMAVRNSAYDYNGRQIKPEISVNGVRIA